MKIFIDSANIDEIKKANEWGVIDGATTNPSLIAKEKNKNVDDIIQEIIDTVNGPISIEVMSTETEEMIKEAIKLSELSENVVIKIPMIPNGLRAVKMLKKKNPEIKTNMTLIFNVCQSLLAARVGATYASIFVGRLDDIGHNGIDVIRDISNIFYIHDIETKIIAASIRSPLNITESVKAGTDIVTIPFNIIEKMIYHPMTDIGIRKFQDDFATL